MEHIYEKHKNCNRSYCSICEGGLSYCMNCNCIEGSLPTECPNDLSAYVLYGDDIYVGKIDFVDGKWQEGKISIHSPAKYR